VKLSLHLEPAQPPIWFRSILPLLAVLITFLLTAGLLLLLRANPLEGYYYFLIKPLSGRTSAIEILVKATPLLLTGAAVAFAFAGGYWNIGAEGQLYAGATAATAVGLQMESVSPWLALPLMLLGGFFAGMVWALIPALMKVRLKIDEVVTTLLLNSVAILIVSAILNGPWRDPISQWPQSPDIAAAAIFPKLIARSRLHLGFVVALIVIAVLWFILERTGFGMRMRAVGLSPKAAQFSGINGIHYHLIDAISPGYGYTGIIVATLGSLHAVGITIAALFIGLIDTGGQTISRAMGVPSFLGDVIQATLLLVTLAVLLLQRYRITLKG